MDADLISAHLLLGALAAIDAATVDLDLVAVIDANSGLGVEAAILADALAAEADALETVIARARRRSCP